MTTKELVAESNRIEGILREPTSEEVRSFEWFLDLDEVGVLELESFVRTYQPDAVLRDKPGMDVVVGNHVPIPGGPGIEIRLGQLLVACNSLTSDLLIDAAYELHCRYEELHPFMDCNGHSGRMLWYWMMREQPIARELGFLHTFYYQSLRHGAGGGEGT